MLSLLSSNLTADGHNWSVLVARMANVLHGVDFACNGLCLSHTCRGILPNIFGVA